MAGFGNWGPKNTAKIASAMSLRAEFKFGSISAVRDRSWMSTGDLIYAGQEVYNEFRRELAADNIEYAVYSFSTPIAWVLKNGNVKKVDHRFSQTTTGAQRLVSLYL